ncbi:hypothetical protein F5878DRAFT_647875, partial [Lentinula raphanica]
MKATLTGPLGPLLKDGGWVAVVNQARKAVNRWHQKKGTPSANGTLHPMQQMLDHIDQYAGKEDYTKIVQNLYFAALHLAWLEQDSSHGARIDYPETAQQFSNHLQRIGSHLAVSPLLLLRPTSLTQNSCNRETLLHVAYALGPHEDRPAVLKEIEACMWTHLRRVSRNEISANELLDVLVNKFSTDLLDTVSKVDNQFFSQDYDERRTDFGGGGFIEEMIRAGTPSPVGETAYIENVIRGTTPAPTRPRFRHPQPPTPSHSPLSPSHIDPPIPTQFPLRSSSPPSPSPSSSTSFRIPGPSVTATNEQRIPSRRPLLLPFVIEVEDEESPFRVRHPLQIHHPSVTDRDQDEGSDMQISESEDNDSPLLGPKPTVGLNVEQPPIGRTGDVSSAKDVQFPPPPQKEDNDDETIASDKEDQPPPDQQMEGIVGDQYEQPPQPPQSKDSDEEMNAAEKEDQFPSDNQTEGIEGEHQELPPQITEPDEGMNAFEKESQLPPDKQMNDTEREQHALPRPPPQNKEDNTGKIASEKEDQPRPPDQQ